MVDAKLPPQDTEAEQSVLGSILIDPDALLKVADSLFPEHFYTKSHQVVYEAMLELFETRQPTDVLTLRAQLEKNGKLKAAGGVGAISALVASVPTSANIEHYATLVRDQYIKRSLISVGTKVAEMGYETKGESAETLLENAEQLIFSITQEQTTQGFTPLSRTLELAFDRLAELSKNPGELRGVPTGFPKLDFLLSGLQGGDMIIAAARPSVGKTSFMLNIAHHAAVVRKMPVGIFSLETSTEQLAYRMLAAQANIDGWRLFSGKLQEEDHAKISHAMGVLASSPIFIDDTPGQGVMAMRTRARRLHMERGIKLIMVDYLQLSHSRNLESRVQEVSEISMHLKSMARELNVPVLVVSQLSRNVEQRGEHKPQLSDLRDSGSIEQDADVVMFLHRPDPDARESVKLTIAKHRNGPTGEIDLFFKEEQTKFYEMDESAGEAG